MQILSPEAFAAKVRDYGKNQVKLIARKAALAVFSELSENLLLLTPVLTGHARHNWQFTAGTPETEEIEGVYGGDTTGDKLTGDEESEIEQLKADFLNSSNTMIFLTNNVPYIQRLEDGYSAKAPAGMVLPAINATLQVLKDKKLNLK